MEEIKDDGSLSFLNIPRNEESRSFNCETITQQKLVNTEFWVRDFLEDVPTKFSKAKGTNGQTLVLISRERDTNESDSKKFFTGSQDILYVLRKIRELHAFPRRVTMRAQGNRYVLE